MTRTTHFSLMLGLLAVGALLFFSGGVGGGALFLLWPLLCLGSMVAMMWFMGGMSSGSGSHSHDDGTTHAHDDAARRTRR